MWLPNDVIAEVERVAMVRYIDVMVCKRWNEHRRDGELRLLTGWMWQQRRGGLVRQGFKTRTVAIRDAYYVLVKHSEVPSVGRPGGRPRPSLRVVSESAA